MIPAFNTKEFDKYLEDIGKGNIRHIFYEVTSTHEEDMGVHVEGTVPEKLLDKVRPNEHPDSKKYRKDIWESVTVGGSQKIINTVNKIFNKRFFKIEFPEMPKTIKEEENLATYTREEFPGYLDIMNFIKETFTKKDFADPNSLLFVGPKSFEVEETERFEPISIIYKASQVVDFQEEVYYTLLLDPKTIKIITWQTIRIYKLIVKKQEERWELFFEHPHKMGKTPAFRLGGIIKGNKIPYWFWSFIGGVLPHWNRVVTLTSDLDANYISHLFMERWEWDVECDECDGDGFVSRTINLPGGETDTDKVQCQKCNGTGSQGKSAYGVTKVRSEAINPDKPIPTPPIEYIIKPTEIVGIIENRIEKEEERGFSSVNMEILNNVPAPESGIAKAIDRQDLDAFLMRYSMHIFKVILPKLFEYITWWRYGETLNWNEKEILKVQPLIEPMKDADFSVLSLQYLTEEFKAASGGSGTQGGSKVSSNYLRELEVEIVNARFSGNEFERKKNLVIVRLQPFPGRNDDNRLTLQSLPGVKEWQIHKSIFIDELVQRAIEENEDFLEMELKEQREIVDKLAQEDFPETTTVEVEPTTITEVKEPVEPEEEPE